MFRLSFLGFFVFILLSSCGSFKSGYTGSSKGLKKALKRSFDTSAIFANQFTGFALYDLLSNELVFEKNAQLFFTPASNTKLVTLLTSLICLKDSVPAYSYILQGDSLIFKGVGDPSLLHPDFQQENEAWKFLKNTDKELYFQKEESSISKYGPGWAWDDYNYGYQCERSALPIFGNFVECTFYKGDSLKIEPAFFRDSFTFVSDSTIWIQRDLDQNVFRVGTAWKSMKSDSIRLERPFIWNQNVAVSALSNLLQKDIKLIEPDDSRVGWSHQYSVPTDSLLLPLMQDSDNFIAEQLLILSARSKFQTVQTEPLMEWMQDSILFNLPNTYQWVDGSGLSRYNLTTPLNMIELLKLIHTEMGMERIQRIFATGGVNGTIKNFYKASTPFVFAKSGTLRNNHCLSGYLLADSGKIYVFSFMNANYTHSSRRLKNQMDQVLQLIKLHG